MFICIIVICIRICICMTVEKDGGTQIKMTMQFDNGMLALVKPMRSVHCCSEA